MKSITSVFVFILAASFSLGTQLPEDESAPADTKIRIPQAASGDPGMYYNNNSSVRAIAKSIPNVRYSQG